MKSTIQLRTAVALLSAALAGALFGPTAAEAQVTLDQYRTAETVYDGFAVSRPDDRGHLKFGVHLTFDYANDPLVYEATSGNADTETFKIVEHQMVGSLALHLGLANRLVLFGGIPLSLWLDGDDLPVGLPAGLADGTGVGDPWLGARLRLLGENDDVASLGLQATATFPLAHAVDDTEAYLGEDGLTFTPKLLLELRGGPLRFTGNAGVLLRKKVGGGASAIGNEFRWAFGVTLDLIKERLTAHGEIFGATPLGNVTNAVKFGDREASPMELLAGLKYFSPKGFSMGLAGGPGLLRGYGSPDVRLIAQIGFAERAEEKAATAPIADTDGDGLRDDEDACPNDPEDMDNFEDQDGCPDPDNDQDGVLDGSDQCPTDAEDADGFEDEDGCPDPDNDQDGIVDAEDACPTAPGQPSEKPEENGCPKSVRVDEASGQIKILQRVEFATSKDVILKQSNDVLVEVGATIAANKQIKRIRVEGHTDDRGNDAKNMDLSKRRARSVAKWLMDSGIAAERLEAYGCGENVPLESNTTNAGRQANRRVEFHIVDPAPKSGVRSTDGCEPIELQ